MKCSRMKKIDSFIISSFIPPFIVTFSIAMFVLVMQILWLYIDDIAGKGVGLWIVLELLGYKCVSLIPMALPLAVLISSVMVLGNMAEHYELSSFKSAGVPLLRMMRPLMFIAGLTTVFSFICSNYLIPVANLQFGSRMWDIQHQKPALQLDEGIFNEDFHGHAIHIKEKSSDERTIHDVLIYDHTNSNRGEISQILANSGEMYSTEDGRYFIMNLKDGNQYSEVKQSRGRGQKKSYPFVRTSFKEWTKIFDLSEFQLNRTNPDLFKSNRHMMNRDQLLVAIDSIALKILRQEVVLHNHVNDHFHYLPKDSTMIKYDQKRNPITKLEKKKAKKVANKKTTKTPAKKTNKATAQPPKVKVNQPGPQKDSLKTNTIGKNKKVKPVKVNKKGGNPIRQEIDTTLTEYRSVVELFVRDKRKRIFTKSKTFARSIHGHAEASSRTLDRMRESKVKHIYEMHTKYSMAVVCFIFLFIGAPMGAIIRKGGFGYPILISIIFFMIFIVLTIFCRKIAESFVLPADVSAWVPCIVLFPIGLLLTTKAMNDTKLFSFDKLKAFFRSFRKKLKSA